MEFLKNEKVAKLIMRAIKAGNKNPTIEQLKTLAVAVGDRESYCFLKNATVRDLSVVKTATVVFNGEAPAKVSEGAGALFGLVGKDATISSDAQARIYDVKAVLAIEEEQKDIEARKKVEDKHPETSDHKAEAATVDAPLKEKTDPKFKEVLERGAKNPVEKRAALTKLAKGNVIKNIRKMTEAELEAQGWGGQAATVLELDDNSLIFPSQDEEGNGPGVLFGLDAKGNNFYVTAAVNAPGPWAVSTDATTADNAVSLKTTVDLGKDEAEANTAKAAEVIDSYVARIKKGEDPRKVLNEFMALIAVTLEDHAGKPKKAPEKKEPEKKEPEKKDDKASEKKEPEKKAPEKKEPEKKGDEASEKKEPEKKDDKAAPKKDEKKPIKATINQGDTINMNSPDSGQVSVTFEPGGQDASGKNLLVGKDPSGNTIMTVPEGADIV